MQFSDTASERKGKAVDTCNGEQCSLCQDLVEDPVVSCYFTSLWYYTFCPFYTVDNQVKYHDWSWSQCGCAFVLDHNKIFGLLYRFGFCSFLIRTLLLLQVTSCAHMFCKSCLIDYSAIMGQDSCPSCSTPLTVDSTGKDCREQNESTILGFKSSSILNRIQLKAFKTSTKIEALVCQTWTPPALQNTHARARTHTHIKRKIKH